MNKHRRLEPWQACRLLTRAIYRGTKKFPRSEMFGLTSQLRRAAVSAGSNIAEGYARYGAKELAHALSISLGSLAEIDSLFAVAEDEDYWSAGELAELEELRANASQRVLMMARRYRSKE